MFHNFFLYLQSYITKFTYISYIGVCVIWSTLEYF